MSASETTISLNYRVYDCPLQRKSQALVVLLLLTTTTAGTWGKQELLSTYSEDLSVHRVEFQVAQRPAERTKGKEKQAEKHPEQVTPIHAITDRLDQLIALQKSANETIKCIPGYTIQVYAGASREAAFKARSKLHVHHPTLRSEVKYDLPNYVVRVGSFLDQLEAYTLYVVIKKQFPQAIVRPISLATNPCIFKQNSAESSGIFMPSIHSE